MFILKWFRKFTKQNKVIKHDLQEIIVQFEILEKENKILLEEIKMLKKLLYGIELDIKKKFKK